MVAQVTPNELSNPNYNKELKGNQDFDMFNNINHPLAITGGGLVLGGAVTYIVGSYSNHGTDYSPSNNTQYIGMGVFAAGAVLFTIFSTERGPKQPTRKKQKSYNKSDWEIE